MLPKVVFFDHIEKAAFGVLNCLKFIFNNELVWAHWKEGVGFG